MMVTIVNVEQVMILKDFHCVTTLMSCIQMLTIINAVSQTTYLCIFGSADRTCQSVSTTRQEVASGHAQVTSQ